MRVLDVSGNHRFRSRPIQRYRLGYTEGADRLMAGFPEWTGGTCPWEKKS